MCVDLDGTLVATDTLWESLLVLARNDLLSLWRVPLWLMRGRSALKQEIGKRVRLNVAALPYREEVLAYLWAQKQAGRRIVLATAADQGVARAIADHLGLFSDVLASDGKTNLKAGRKLEAVRELAGDQGFDYVGDSRADLPLWRASGRALMVAPSASLLRQARRVCPVQQVVCPAPSRVLEVLRAIRVHQWVKNVLLFVPMVLAHKASDVDTLLRVLAAFFSFSFAASCVYLVNDLLDLESDRAHPHKRLRPFAAGRLQPAVGVVLAPVLLIAGLVVGWAWVSAAFGQMIVLYLVLTTLYSKYFKKKPILDVLLLAGLYTYRVLAGTVAASVPASPWLLAFSIFFFLSLAFIKRYADLAAMTLKGDSGEGLPGRGYAVHDVDLLRSLGTSAGYLSVLVLALYINSGQVAALYPQPRVLWLICPLLLYWLSRVWFIAHRGRMSHDPIVFSIKDPVSYLVGVIIVGLIVLASYGTQVLRLWG